MIFNYMLEYLKQVLRVYDCLEHRKKESYVHNIVEWEIFNYNDVEKLARLVTAEAEVIESQIKLFEDIEYLFNLKSIQSYCFNFDFLEVCN